MAIRIAVMILLLVPTAFSQAKVGTTGGQFLQLSPSVRSNGMGTIGVVLIDNRSFCYNPATLGLVGVRHGSLSFNPLAAEFGDTDASWRSESVVAKLYHSDRGGSGPTAVAIAYDYVHLNSGPMPKRTYYRGPNYPSGVPGGTGRTFAWRDYLHRLAIGVGWSGKVDFGVGIAAEYIRAAAHEYSANSGAVAVGTVMSFSLTGEGSGVWRAPRLTVGASYSHSFIEKSAPIPKTGRVGVAVEFAREREGRALWTILPALEREVLLSGRDRGTWKSGLEIEYSELISGRVGYNMPDEAAINHATFGFAFSTHGLRKTATVSESAEKDRGGFFRFLADNLNVELSFAHVGAHIEGWKGTVYYGVELTL